MGDGTRMAGRGWGKVTLVAGAVVALLLVARAVDAPGLLRQALDGIRGLGAWGAVLFVGLYDPR